MQTRRDRELIALISEITARIDLTNRSLKTLTALVRQNAVLFPVLRPSIVAKHKELIRLDVRLRDNIMELSDYSRSGFAEALDDLNAIIEKFERWKERHPWEK